MKPMIRLPWAVLLVCACATSPAPVPSPEKATPPTAQKAPPPPPAQYRLAGFDVVGVHKEPVDQIIAMLDPPPLGTVIVQGHNPWPKKLAEARERIAKRFPFAQCRFEFGAFYDNSLYITVDWVDKGEEWRMKFDPAPTENLPDPDGILAAWDDAGDKREALIAKGELPAFNSHPLTEQFGTCHHALLCMGGFGHPELAPLEQKFIDGVPKHFDEIVRVLREDADPKKRTLAAMVLSYAPSREKVAQAALPSVRDPDQGVRNEVLRLLGSAQEGVDHVIVPLDSILDALWFPHETDRNKAGWALVRITEVEHGAHAKHIAEKAGEMLVEMASMRSRLDYEPAQRVLKAISGEDHGGDAAAWRAWLARVEK